MNELEKLMKLESQYRKVAPNGKEHKLILEQIASIQKTSTPEVPYIKDMVSDVKENANARRWDIKTFYDNAINSTGLNKASTFTFWSSADKWVPLQIQKQNLVKLNEDVAWSINQLAWAKLDKTQAVDANEQAQLNSLKTLKVNADNTAKNQDLQKEQLMLNKEQADATLSEQQRQFNISKWLNADGSAPAAKAVATTPKTNTSGNYTSTPKAFDLAASWVQVQAPYNNTQKEWIPFLAKDWRKYMIKDGKLLPIQ